MKHILPSITLLILFCVNGTAQTTITGKVIDDRNFTHTSDYIFIARDEIILDDGFLIDGTAGNTLEAYIDESLVFDTEYQTPTDPDTRDLNTSYKVGSIPGSTSVSAGGSATYSIPIFTPPGTTGLNPGISINYNSSSGNGVLGMGWHIGGLSSISRDVKNIYMDGTIDGINFTLSDPYTFDGNRLVLVNGTHGTDGASYHTEAATFMKITAHGSSSNGPAWFEVETKNGITMEFGNTNDSKVKAYYRDEILHWRLNKIYDKNNNYITFHYNTSSEAYGESWITEINYTGNSTTSLEPYNTIYFYYENRTADQNTYFIKGTEYRLTKLLRSIKVEHDGEMVRRYDFNYSSDLYTHLNEIVEYGSDQSRFNSTIITWGSSTTDFEQVASTVTFANDTTISGDFNGDGQSDILRIPLDSEGDFLVGGTWRVYTASSTGQGFTQIAYGTINDKFFGFIVGDFNGDGLDDLMEKSKEALSLQCFGDLPDTVCKPIYTINLKLRKANGSGFDSPVTKISGEELTLNHDIRKVNANGDGIDDLFLLEYGDSLTSRKYTFNSSGDAQLGVLPINTVTATPRLFYDFTGDGKDDLIVLDGDGYTIFNGFSWDPYCSGTAMTKSTKNYFGDFNGDGKTDFLTYTTTGWKLYYNTGTAFSTGTVPFSTNVDPENDEDNYNYIVADFNGDGKSDILEYIYYSGSKYVHIYYSTGLSFVHEAHALSGIGYIRDGETYGDFNGDGQQELFVSRNDSYTEKILRFHTDNYKQLVSKVTNGLNQQTTFVYKPLTWTTFYTKGSNAEYPLVDYQGALKKVYSISTPNGNGGLSTTYYSYEGAILHMKGRGLLGFTKVTSQNTTMNRKIISTYEPNLTYYFMESKQTEVKNVANDNISKTEFVNSVTGFGSKRFFSYISHSTFTDYLTGITKDIHKTYDNYGNNDNTYISYNNGSATTINTFYGTHGTWCPASPDSVITSSTKTGYDDQIHRTHYTYNAHLVSSIIVDPNTTKAVTISFTYGNQYGLVTRTDWTTTDAPDRYQTYGYDSKYRFQTSVNNALSQSTSATYDGATGNVLTSTDIYGTKTTYTYDGFGQLVSSSNPVTGTATNSVTWSDGTYESDVFKQTITATEKPTVVKYYDMLGRAFLERTEKFEGTNIYTKVEFNNDGSVYRTSQPYTSTADAWNYNQYDEYNRLERTYGPGYDNSVTFNNLQITETNNLTNLSATKTMNALGQVVSATDIGGNSLSYTYYPSGQLHQATSDNGTVTYLYDLQGNVISSTSPNIGASTSSYNGFGQPLEVTDSRGYTTSFTYDNLGRTLTKTNTTGVTNYTYVTSGNGKGQTKKITAPNGHAIEFVYDSYGRPTSQTQTIHGQNYAFGYMYDNLGRMAEMTYPSNFKVNYEYNSRGYLYRLNNEAGTKIWEQTSTNNFGQVTGYSLGNGLTTTKTYNDYGQVTSIQTGSVQDLAYTYYDATTHNMQTRKDLDRSLVETFTYDDFNRLVSYKPNNISTAFTINYAANGNIEEKSDLGTYGYTNTNLPNAVTQISEYTTLMKETPQNISYNHFGKVDSIAEDSYVLQLEYGLTAQRIYTRLENNSNFIKSKVFVGALYEIDTLSDGTVRQLHYIPGPDGLAAIYTITDDADSMHYVHKDHLGSYDVITNENGDEEERYSFDPWGRRRNPTDWTFNNVPASYLFDRGFTGHEHLDAFNLINMNGRVYDPLLARFLSPDKVMTGGYNSQGYNSYSYVFNNPMMYTDPSGWILRSDPSYPIMPKYPDGAGGGGGGLLKGEPTMVGGQWSRGWQRAPNMHNYVSYFEQSGSMGYYYNDGAYYDRAIGETVSFETALSGSLQRRGGSLKPGSDYGINAFDVVTALTGKSYSFSGSETWNVNGRKLGHIGNYYNHYFELDPKTGKFYIPYTNIAVDPVDVLLGATNRGVGDQRGTYIFDRNGKQLAHYQTGALEVRYVREKNKEAFNQAISYYGQGGRVKSYIERLNGAIQNSESIEVKKYPYRDNLYHMVLPTDWTYWKSLLGEWMVKSYGQDFNTGPLGPDPVGDAFKGERWKYESGVPIIIP